MTKKIYFIFVLLLCFGLSAAQDRTGHNPYSKGYNSNMPSYSSSKIDPVPTAPITPPTPAIPIDGGASFLVAAGLGYGIRKFRKKK